MPIPLKWSDEVKAEAVRLRLHGHLTFDQIKERLGPRRASVRKWIETAIRGGNGRNMVPRESLFPEDYHYDWAPETLHLWYEAKYLKLSAFQEKIGHEMISASALSAASASLYRAYEIMKARLEGKAIEVDARQLYNKDLERQLLETKKKLDRLRRAQREVDDLTPVEATTSVETTAAKEESNRKEPSQ
jgi:hypothetical protein